MSDPVLVAIIVAVQGIAVAYLNRKATQTRDKVAAVENHIIETKTAMVALEKNTNSKFDQLVQTTGREQRAAGNLEGRAEQEKENDQQ